MANVIKSACVLDNRLEYFFVCQNKVVVFVCKTSAVNLDFCCIFLWRSVFLIIFVDSEGLQVDMQMTRRFHNVFKKLSLGLLSIEIFMRFYLATEPCIIV